MRTAPVLAALLLVCVAVAAGVAPVLDTERPDHVRAVASSGVDGETTRTDVTPVRSVRRPGTATAPATPAGSVSAVNATNVTAVNVSRILALPTGATPTATIEAVDIDAGVAVAFGTNASAARMETLSIRERVRSADTAEARSQAVLNAMNDVENRAVTLRVRHRAVLRAYANGEATATELVVDLARIQSEARALSERVRVLVSLAQEIDGFSLNAGRAQSLLYDLDTFGGPVTDRSVAALRGTAGPTRLYVSATGANVALTTVASDEYVREAYRTDLRRLDGSAIRAPVARNVTARSYPEIWSARTSTSGAGEGETFIYEVMYPSGHLTAFVDGGTERVFKEHQRINVTQFPTGPVANRTQNGLTLAVNRTYAGGPLRVTLTDASTGEPIDATVQLGSGGESVTVGRTGDDGLLWTLSPQGGYYVTAVQTATANAANVDTSTVEPATVAEAYNRSGSTGTGTGGNATPASGTRGT